MRERSVAKAAMVVDASASLGIFNKELFSMMKLTRVITAKIIARINFQLRSIRMRLAISSKFPEINDRSPIKTIDNALVMQNANSQKITNIMCG